MQQHIREGVVNFLCFLILLWDLSDSDLHQSVYLFLKYAGFFLLGICGDVNPPHMPQSLKVRISQRHHRFAWVFFQLDRPAEVI